MVNTTYTKIISIRDLEKVNKMEGVFDMNTVTIACLPKSQTDGERVSFNFSTIQLPKEKYLVWHVISQIEEDNNIHFTVMQEGSQGDHPVIFEDMQDGFIMRYEGMRNLYIANPRNVTGHFMVEVEAVSNI